MFRMFKLILPKVMKIQSKPISECMAIGGVNLPQSAERRYALQAMRNP